MLNPPLPSLLDANHVEQVSTALAGGVILKALAQRPNFYSAAVYLSQSSANLMILTNLVFMLACATLFGLQKLLYGPLRPIEIEQLYEKGWFAVTETCLAMTIFRGEIGAWFLIMFFSLLAGKVWQWIGEGRVEILEQQPPRNPRLFHTRLALSLGLSVAFDLTMLEYVVNQVMRMARPDMMVMFGFEFAVLSIMSMSTAARYAITLVEISIVREQKRRRAEEMKKERIDAAKTDIQTAERIERGDLPPSAPQEGDTPEPAAETPPAPTVEEAREALRQAEQPIDENEVEVEGWDAKGRYVFYLDLATDFFKLVIYLSFFVILLVFYGLPIHIMRDVFLTTRSFFKRISDFMKYRTATRDMNERYPDATEEDIGREDVCIICREEMRPYPPTVPGQQQQTNPVVERMRPKKLPCGHVLHFSCLRSWLERQQVCPTCRRPVVAAPGAALDANGQPAAAAAQPGQHPPPAQGARVFQFGPLRIGVGAARGNNMFEELQQQLQDGRAGELQRVERNGPQQYGFGIRWDGRTRRGHRRRDHGSVRDQLDRVEQQIQEEMRALAQNTREYAVLRNMQVELDRLRAERNAVAPTGSAATTVTTTTALPPPAMPMASMTIPQRLQVPAGEHAIQASSPHLPPGMTLPEGWSMMPLRPTQAQPPILHPPPGLPMPAQFPQQLQGTFAGPTHAPDHIRAMFSNMPGQPPQRPTQAHPQAPHDGMDDRRESIIAAQQRMQQMFGQQNQNVFPGNAQGAAQGGPQNPNVQQNGAGPHVQGELFINGQRFPMPDNSFLHRDPNNPFGNAMRERHDAYLQSLRNPQPHAAGGPSAPESGTSTVVPPTQPEPRQTMQPEPVQTNGTHNEAQTHAIPTRSFGQPSPVTPQPLPIWGSRDESTASVREEEKQQMSDGAETGSSSRTQEEKSKQATVEDLVEGPD